MKRQIIAIHGADAYNSYKEYLKELKNEPVERDDFKRDEERGWKDRLAKNLGNDYEVFNPEMPNASNAKYAEWKIWFEKLLRFVGKGPVFIGHSLGGIFLARYFAENPDKHEARGVFLLAPPYKDPSTKPKERIADFILPKDTSRLVELGGRLHFYFSKDDPVVSFSNLAKYKKIAPDANVRIFTNKGHFILKEFPEIIEGINNSFN